MRSLAISILLAAAMAAPGTAANFYAISGDPNNSFVPDQFSQVTSSVTTIGTLGDGSLAFNGGLTVANGTIYAIANDSSENSSFYSIQPDGTIALIGSAGGLGTGFLGGLTFDTANGNFYALSLNGASSIVFSIDSSGVANTLNQDLGSGFSGLAYDEANGLFYGIGNGGGGNSTLYDFSLGGSVNLVAALGTGFGALTYDAVNNTFWAISPVSNSGSQLFQISPVGAVSSPVMTLGDGFVELATQAPPVPEPAAAIQVGIGLSLLFTTLRIYRRRMTHEKGI